MTPSAAAPVSVMVLAYNEERNLPILLESLAGFSDDVVIVDSFSTDRTLEIARDAGCRIVQNRFVNHAVQCNWALDTVDFRHDWILRLDCDEVLLPAVRAELAEMARCLPADVGGIYIPRRIYFLNRWLRHGGIYPHVVLRMFRHQSGRFEQKTEEHFVVRVGRTVRARNDFLENNRLNTLKYWLVKHDQLADHEVDDTSRLDRQAEDELPARLFGERPERIRWLKRHVYGRTPPFARAFLYFLYRYILRGGFRDGVPGLIFHVLQGFWYRFYIDARIWERRSRWQDHIPTYDDR